MKSCVKKKAARFREQSFLATKSGLNRCNLREKRYVLHFSVWHGKSIVKKMASKTVRRHLTVEENFLGVRFGDNY